MQDVEEQPARWCVRTEVCRIGGEQCMHRADRKSIGAACGGAYGKVAQRAKIADTAATFAPQAVELGGEHPHAAAPSRHVARKRMGRCHSSERRRVREKG